VKKHPVMNVPGRDLFIYQARGLSRFGCHPILQEKRRHQGAGKTLQHLKFALMYASGLD
jgi:hypothetical protein